MIEPRPIYPRSRFTENFITDYALSEYEELDSTNAQALRLTSDGEVGNHWVVAKIQSAGRGRSGRPWCSEPGNLFTSLLLEVPCTLGTASQLSFVAGLAAFDVLEQALSANNKSQLQLKWPNDLLLEGAKIGGILLESKFVADAEGQEQLYVVIGTGINLVSHPELENRKTTHLEQYGILLTPSVALQNLAKSTQSWLDVWQWGTDFAKIKTAWLARSCKIGSEMSVHIGQKRIRGRFSGLNAQGGLLLTPNDGKTIEIQAGDVVLNGE